MYLPYLRGKKNEILAIRETASLMSKAGIIPIIEPVHSSLKDVELAIQGMCDAGGRAVVIINPQHGDHAKGKADIISLLEDTLKLGSGISAGVLLSNKMDADQLLSMHYEFEKHNPVLIHSGLVDYNRLVERLNKNDLTFTHIFNEEFCSLPYREAFSKFEEKILLRDGFRKRRNVDYPPVEIFSDLNIRYKAEGLSGFSDFSIVGDEYTESGGPAYAVAIHISFIDHHNGGAMYIHHFISDENDLPINPAGKFGEALSKLMKKLDSGTSQIYESSAIKEFRELHAQRHFPGLGTLKKLSIKHHIETIAQQLQRG